MMEDEASEEPGYLSNLPQVVVYKILYNIIAAGFLGDGCWLALLS